ncbi:MAG: cytochrome c biogenesis protein CcsA, partial [Armatimonadota bacterium]|nr:cytochrome c biogenesis protein CcsA [Armatimonadota bacterium]
MAGIYKVVCGVWIAGVVVASLGVIGPAAGFREPDAARIIFFHVPVAWLSVLGFLIAMLNAIRYLRRREDEFDVRSAAAAEMGFVFCILATLTGAIFAQVQ